MSSINSSHESLVGELPPNDDVIDLDALLGTSKPTEQQSTAKSSRIPLKHLPYRTHRTEGWVPSPPLSSDSVSGSDLSDDLQAPRKYNPSYSPVKEKYREESPQSNQRGRVLKGKSVSFAGSHGWKEAPSGTRIPEGQDVDDRLCREVRTRTIRYFTADRISDQTKDVWDIELDVDQSPGAMREIRTKIESFYGRERIPNTDRKQPYLRTTYKYDSDSQLRPDRARDGPDRGGTGPKMVSRSSKQMTSSTVSKRTVSREALKKLGHKVLAENELTYTIQGTLHPLALRDLEKVSEQLSPGKPFTQILANSDASTTSINLLDRSAEELEILNFAQTKAHEFEMEVQNECWDSMPKELVQRILKLHALKEAKKRMYLLQRDQLNFWEQRADINHHNLQQAKSNKYQATVEDDHEPELVQDDIKTSDNDNPPNSVIEEVVSSQALVKTRQQLNVGHRKIEIEIPRETRAVFVAGEHGYIDFIDADERLQHAYRIPTGQEDTTPVLREPLAPPRDRRHGAQGSNRMQAEMIELLHDIRNILADNSQPRHMPELPEEIPATGSVAASNISSDHSSLDHEMDNKEPEKIVKQLLAPPKNKQKRTWKKRYRPKKDTVATPA